MVTMQSLNEIFSVKNEVSFESMADLLIERNAISTENLSDLLSGLLGRTKDVVNYFTPSFRDEAYKMAMGRANHTKSKVMTLNNIDLNNIVIIVPDAFTGNYIKYLDVMISTIDSIVNNLRETTHTLSVDISRNINEFDVNVASSPSSIIQARRLRSMRDTYQSTLSKSFTVKKSRSHAKMLEVFNSPNEVVTLYDRVNTLEKTISAVELSNIPELEKKLAIEVNSYVSLLQENRKDIGPARKEVKELSEVVYEVGKSFEFIGYLMANVLQVYKSVESIGVSVAKYNKA